MIASRCNTGEHLAAILDILSNAKTNRVILFASSLQPDGNYNRDRDETETNLPQVVGLAEIKISETIEPLYVIFDGPFLTAVRRPRYLEVRDLLDAATASGKAFFSKERAPFTSSLNPYEAARELLRLEPFVPLTTETRVSYFELLSSTPESSYV